MTTIARLGTASNRAAPRSVGAAWVRISPYGLVAAVVVGCAWVLATADLGSGDYGQWLMAARPYVGETVPAYRDATAIPPVVPIVIGAAARLVPDRADAVRVTALVVLVALATSAYLAGRGLFAGRLAGAGAVIGTLLLTDAFLELFAFGGLLQAGAITFLMLAFAAFGTARRQPHRWAPWLLGAAAVGLGAMTHMGTASILVPAGLVAAAMAALALSRGERARRLAPLGVVLAAVAAYWLVVLLPNSTDLARNPASLTYRGPSRLWDALVSFWPTVVLGLLATAGFVAGLGREWRRRRLGPWTIVAGWTLTTLLVVAGAIASGASTDYPRFATPILSPVAVAAGAALAANARAVSASLRGWMRRRARIDRAFVAVAVVVVIATPLAVQRFEQRVAGYALRDAASLYVVADWINGNIAADATVLAPVREGKWLEGLTGRAALFSSAIRYSFRAEEWRRSLASETLLRSGGAIVNRYFLALLSDVDATVGAPRSVTVAANHGGEYVDLLQTVPSQTLILAGANEPPVARLSNLAPLRRDDHADRDSARVTMRWAGERERREVMFRQTLSLLADASTLELVFAAETRVPIDGFSVTFRPARSAELSSFTAIDREVELRFGSVAGVEPRLRVVVGRGASLDVERDGTLRVGSSGVPVRVLVTDLTASPSDDIGVSILRPQELVERYRLDAAVLPMDALYAPRAERLATLGFAEAAEVGPYGILQRTSSFVTSNTLPP
ncbi:MAG: hypothetical protein ABR509_02475 [Candidatus Limnocylindria bacterium]